MVMLSNQASILLREAAYYVPEVGESLLTDAEAMTLLFWLLRNTLTFNNAVALVDEVLSLRPGTFDLTRVRGFSDLVTSMNPWQLATFCRVLGQLLYDPDRFDPVVYAGKELVSRARRSEQVKSLEKNHALICAVPGLIERFAKLLHVQQVAYTSTIERMLRNVPFAHDLLLLFLGQDDGESWASLQRSDSPMVAVSQEEGLPDSVPLYALVLSTHQIEILFVVCSLLASKRKPEVQERLAGADIIAALSRLFAGLSWTDPHATSDDGLHPHGPGCDCNSEASVRVQLLRLVLHFCDRGSAFKDMMLSEYERRAAATGQFTPGFHALPPPPQPPRPQPSPDGLLSSMMRVLFSLSPESNYRFWISSCLESFLRGNDGPTKTWLASGGLVAHLVSEIEANKYAPALQTNFDLLGELVRHDATAMALLESAIVASERQSILPLARENVLDSNVFIRALVLTADHFPEGARQRWPTIVSFVEAGRPTLLRRLIGTVTADDITQESICCVNTALVMLALERRKGRGRMADLFESFVQEELVTVGCSSTLLQCFRGLLGFHRHYYTIRGGDRSNLEQTSHLSMSELTDTRRELMALIDSTESRKLFTLSQPTSATAEEATMTV